MPVPPIVPNPSLEGNAPVSPIPGESNNDFNAGWSAMAQDVAVVVQDCLRENVADGDFGSATLGSGDTEIHEEGWIDFSGQIAGGIMSAVSERLKGWLWENWKKRGRRPLVKPTAIRVISPGGMGGH